MAGKAHHSSARYQRWAPVVTRTAALNPRAVCAICGRTLAEHEPHASGKPVTWHAGHTKDASLTPRPWLHVERMPPPGDWLAPTASTCNIIDGNLVRRGISREPRSEHW